jgi:hypothetical protein
MKRVLVGLLLVLPLAAVNATQVIDDFESGTDPNQWGWTNGGGGFFIIQPDGGNPGAWLDSGVPYFSDHPNLTSIPPEGTPLHDALASGALSSASIDIERLDTSDVNNCHPTAQEASTFSLSFIDLHSDPGGSVIEAHNDNGPPSPAGIFPWLTVTFTIDSAATDVPPGWVLNAPPELNYTWQDLMQNMDGIRVFVINPEQITFDGCSHLGADNIVITYGTSHDVIFEDGFDIASRR